jgi:hypothetical protein
MSESETPPAKRAKVSSDEGANSVQEINHTLHQTFEYIATLHQHFQITSKQPPLQANEGITA